MAEPATATVISLKWLLLATGSAIGSAISLVFTPAKNHVDAALRFACCFAFTMAVAPITTRAVAKYCAASAESIPDLTLCVAAIFGLVSWIVMGAIHKFVSKNSEKVAEEGFAAYLPKRKDPS